MPKYVIERNMPGVGSLSHADLRRAIGKPCSVLKSLGPDIQWVQSYVTADKVYCVYIAANEDIIRRHAVEAGLPADRISAVKTIIDPTIVER